MQKHVNSSIPRKYLKSYIPAKYTRTNIPSTVQFALAFGLAICVLSVFAILASQRVVG